MDKIKTKDELLKYLLFDDICVGVHGDTNIRENMTKKFGDKIKKLLDKK